MGNGACFFCRNSTNGRVVEPGWTYDCAVGQDTSLMEHRSRDTESDELRRVISCHGGDVRYGFQLGGYYTHMYFEKDGPLCLKWHMKTKGFPDCEDDEEFHICDFRQIEEFVKFWGEELRRRGWVREDE